jgi:hypothetical protein
MALAEASYDMYAVSANHYIRLLYTYFAQIISFSYTAPLYI